MRNALIVAGGSGTRLWPWSRSEQPKQLIPFLNGKSLLETAVYRLAGLVGLSQIYICASEQHRDAVLSSLPDFPADQYLAEPMGRDTLNAVALGTAVIASRDPDATVAIFTADHLIEPIDTFQTIVTRGFEAAEANPRSLVTFGITPDLPSTSYGYLELGESLGSDLFRVQQFREKPDADTAGRFLAAGPERYLWNSGMFVWRPAALLNCVKRYQPETSALIDRMVDAWATPERDLVVREIYPTLRKISIDYAVMEPASQDPEAGVLAVPMNLRWIDVGSWPMFAKTCDKDEQDNAVSAKSLLMSSSRNLVASSDPNHLIATIGCEDLIIIHTPEATLVCRADQAEAIKELHKRVGERFGAELL